MSVPSPPPQAAPSLKASPPPEAALGVPVVSVTLSMPDGEGGRTYRYTRAPAPMRLTLCNGVATFDYGAFTGRFPGHYIGPRG